MADAFNNTRLEGREVNTTNNEDFESSDIENNFIVESANILNLLRAQAASDVNVLQQIQQQQTAIIATTTDTTTECTDTLCNCL